MHSSGSNKTGGRVRQEPTRLMSRRQLNAMAEKVAVYAEAGLSMAGLDDRYEAFVEFRPDATNDDTDPDADHDCIISFRLDEELESGEEDDSSLPVFLSCGLDGAIHMMVVDEDDVIHQGPERGIADINRVAAELCEFILELQRQLNPTLH